MVNMSLTKQYEALDMIAQDIINISFIIMYITATMSIIVAFLIFDAHTTVRGKNVVLVISTAVAIASALIAYFGNEALALFSFKPIALAYFALSYTLVTISIFGALMFAAAVNKGATMYKKYIQQ